MLHLAGPSLTRSAWSCAGVDSSPWLFPSRCVSQGLVLQDRSGACGAHGSRLPGTAANTASSGLPSWIVHNAPRTPAADGGAGGRLERNLIPSARPSPAIASQFRVPSAAGFGQGGCAPGASAGTGASSPGGGPGGGPCGGPYSGSASFILDPAAFPRYSRPLVGSPSSAMCARPSYNT